MTRARDLADGKFANDLTVDTDTLYVDSANNRVGVGTTSPASAAGNALVVHDTSAPRIRLTSNTTGETATDGAEISLLTSAFVVENREASDTIFFNNGAERMRIDASGRVTTPNQPMFTVNGVAAASTTPGNAQVLNFSGVYLNVGGHFNISTDRFVAPVTGHYFFAFSCMTTTQSHTSNIVIRKNGGGRHSSYTQNATYLRHNIAVVEQLAANDYVDIVLEHGGVHAGFDHFSGFLIG